MTEAAFKNTKLNPSKKTRAFLGCVITFLKFRRLKTTRQQV